MPLSRHGVEHVAQEVQKNLQEQCTFTPNKKKQAQKKLVMSKKKLDLLAKNKNDLYQKRILEKEAKDAESLKMLPFKVLLISNSC